MQKIQTFVDVMFAACFIGILLYTVVYFLKAKGTIWERILSTTRNSATIVWAHLVGLAGAGISVLASVADLINEPQISSAITSYLSPNIVAGIMVTVAFVTVVARRRTLPPSPNAEGAPTATPVPGS